MRSFLLNPEAIPVKLNPVVETQFSPSEQQKRLRMFYKLRGSKLTVSLLEEDMLSCRGQENPIKSNNNYRGVNNS